jgi:hypothetical protein
MRSRVFFVSIVTALVCAGAANAFATYPVIDETSSWIAMRPVSAHCLTKAETAADFNMAVWGASAYVNVTDDGSPEDYAVYEYGLCEQLLALHNGQRVNTADLAWSILALTHESYHLRGAPGWMNEGRANCNAIRHVRYVALHLGADQSHSYSLLSAALVWFHRQPAAYRLPGCNLPRG